MFQQNCSYKLLTIIFSTLFVFVNSIDNELKKDRNCLVKIGTKTWFNKKNNKKTYIFIFCILCYVFPKGKHKIKVFDDSDDSLRNSSRFSMVVQVLCIQLNMTKTSTDFIIALP